MRNFETRIIREHDAQGRLIGAGLSWVEGRCTLTVIVTVVFWLSIFVCVVAAVEGLANPFARLAAALGAAHAAFWLWIVWRWGTRERSVIFYADRIEAPHGLPRRVAPSILNLPLGDTANIEMWGGPSGEIFVLLYARDGGSYLLGRGVNEFQARKIVVQLTHARQELSDSLAAPSRAGGAPASTSLIA